MFPYSHVLEDHSLTTKAEGHHFYEHPIYYRSGWGSIMSIVMVYEYCEKLQASAAQQG